MTNPLFWLGLSVLLVAIGLLAMLIVAVSLLRELSRTARSAERLCDILARDLPPTLEAIRLTGLEITELADDVNQGVHQAGSAIRQLDQGLSDARQQAQQVQIGSRSLWAGVAAAWRTWQSPPRRKRPRRLHSRHGTAATPRQWSKAGPQRPSPPNPDSQVQGSRAESPNAAASPPAEPDLKPLQADLPHPSRPGSAAE